MENTLHSPVKVLINGQIAGTVKARATDRFVVPDGNHYIRIQSSDRSGATSRDIQFYTQSRRFFFRATSPNPTSVSLTRESVYEIATVAKAAPTAVATAQSGGEPAEVPLSQTALGQDKAATFNRLDAVVGAPGAGSAQAQAAPAQTSPTPAAAPASAASPAAAQAAPAAGQKPVEKQQVAVYVTGDRSDGERKALGTKMLVALVNSGRYIAIERSDEFLAKIDDEQLKQRSGAVDDNQISHLGKQFGVRYVCVATITQAFGAYQVSARIIDVETAVVVAVGEDSSQLRNMDDLDSVSFRVVRAMLK
jgi:hypothetical protein